MGIEKRRMEETEAAWDRKAQAESIQCNICSTQIPYCDRETFYTTGMCGYCAYQAEKND